ncbi:MAG: hypothetical protein K0R44_3829, partial [Thermomicrobiales bacterium]|nr:hypothetical protein [Thermomicrobiales bacterium]
MDLLHRVPARRQADSMSDAPPRLWIGLALAIVSWWIAWFGPAPYSEHTFFPLWLGYILAVDGLTMRRAGTSLLARDRHRFVSLFVFSIPLWWLFEFANRYLDNWRYLLPRPYHPVEYALLASLAFSTVMPAIFVTAELLRT